jgi:long-chain acyl-CoA synthetase
MATPEEVSYILNDCRPEVLFCSADTKENLDKALSNVTYNPNVYLLDKQNYQVDEYKSITIEPKEMDETAVIIYTSGTTGSPKGVMLSFDNLEANIESVCEKIPIYTAERNVLVLLPLHHIFPLMGTLIAPLSVGARIAFSPSMVSEDIMATLQNNEIAIIIGVPRLYEAIRKGIVTKINSSFAAKNLFKLAKSLNSRSFSQKIFKQVHQKFGGKVEYMVCGGAKLNEEVAKDFKALGFEMLEGFGMTEAAPMITFTRPGKWKIGSAGQPVPGVEVKSIDGEIAAKGRVVMKGYYNRPEETAQVVKDGWLFTGDLGYLDKENFCAYYGQK